MLTAHVPPPVPYTVPMWRGISLANKCLLMFGGAIVLIVLMALSVPWLRMNTLVDEGQLELSRQMVETWLRLDADEGIGGAVVGKDEALGVEHAGVRAVRMSLEQARAGAGKNAFLRRALGQFDSDPTRGDYQSAS